MGVAMLTGENPNGGPGGGDPGEDDDKLDAYIGESL